MFNIFVANPASFVYFRPSTNSSITVSITTIQIEKSVDGVLRIQTQDHRMVGTDKKKEL